MTLIYEFLMYIYIYMYMLNILIYIYIHIFSMYCMHHVMYLCHVFSMCDLFIKLLSHRVCKAKSGRIRRDTSMSIVCRVCPGYITELSEDDAQGLNAIIREAGL